MKYPKTWQAIEDALERSASWAETEHLNDADEPVTVYEVIKKAVRYMRQYPTDKELLDWNLVRCAGSRDEARSGSSSLERGHHHLACRKRKRRRVLKSNPLKEWRGSVASRMQPPLSAVPAGRISC